MNQILNTMTAAPISTAHQGLGKRFGRWEMLIFTLFKADKGKSPNLYFKHNLSVSL